MTASGTALATVSDIQTSSCHTTIFYTIDTFGWELDDWGWHLLTIAQRQYTYSIHISVSFRVPEACGSVAPTEGLEGARTNGTSTGLSHSRDIWRRKKTTNTCVFYRE